MNASYYDRFIRGSRRLEGWDYSSEGIYFVTICTAKRYLLFGDIRKGIMELNDFGRIAEFEWHKTFEIRENIVSDRFVVMPNHLHGIIIIPPGTGVARPAAPKQSKQKFGKPIPGSISTIVGAYKSATTKSINILRQTPGVSIWQSRFHDRIIRTEKELDNVRNYIDQNLLMWASDKHNHGYQD